MADYGHFSTVKQHLEEFLRLIGRLGRFFEHCFQLEICHLSNYPLPIYQGTQSKKTHQKFMTEKDILLISAYLIISTDVIQGNKQKSFTYWERVHRYFHEHKKFESTRNSNSLLKRWSIIKLVVNKFCGNYAQIEARSQSGVNDQVKTLKFEEYVEDIKVRDKKRQEEKDRLYAQEQHRLTFEEEKNRIKNENFNLKEVKKKKEL
ncbi:hypothetical protein Dsin_001284 [Dipteronia sinensis]|uniref:Uncharacterized protein n=1 Tax=Dipteronia sinensis TaxID=43782 RepID=A0AAE0EI79_9ROSI|nr:hypothetical protein Dsin_001284 [Dipteronia sinensis]